MKIKNPLKMWYLIPFGVFLTIYIFYMELIKGELPIRESFIPFADKAIIGWANQSVYHLTGQILIFQFIVIGLLVLHIEWKEKNG